MRYNYRVSLNDPSYQDVRLHMLGIWMYYMHGLERDVSLCPPNNFNGSSPHKNSQRSKKVTFTKYPFK